MNTTSTPASAAARASGNDRGPAAPFSSPQPIQAGLVDRQLALPERAKLVGVGLDHGHFGAEFGEAGPRHEPDISATDHRDTQGRVLREFLALLSIKARRLPLCHRAMAFAAATCHR